MEKTEKIELKKVVNPDDLSQGKDSSRKRRGCTGGFTLGGSR